VRHIIVTFIERVRQMVKTNLLTARAVGEILSLSKRQVFRLNSSGKIPQPVRIGGSIRWIESQINEWIAAGAPDRKTFETMQQAGWE
jgi:predicted DNA-binding transcriptional regulator AlpA